MKISESSEFTMPLKNLLVLIAGTAVSVWAYFGIVERISFIEHQQDLMVIEIEENDTWIDEWTPPASVQENIQKVIDLENQLTRMEVELKYLKASINK